MGEFIGKRVIPRHDGEWNPDKAYEPLVIVLDVTTGNSYISRKDVPAGALLTDASYWSVCSRFSEQMWLLEKEVAADVETMHNDVFTAKATMSHELAETKAAMSEELVATKSAMSEELANTKHSMSDELNETEERMDSNLADTQRKVSILVDENREDLTTKVDRAVEQLQTGKSEMNQMGVTLNKRIDSLIANKSVTSNSELLDIRVDAQGETHTTAGAAVRAMDTRLQEAISRKVDMCKDVTGEVISGEIYHCRTGEKNAFETGHCTGLIPIAHEGQSYFYSGRVFNYIGVTGWDINGNFVGSVLDELATAEMRDFEYYRLNIPENVTHIRASSYKLLPKIEMETYVDQVATHTNRMEQRIRKIESEAEKQGSINQYLAKEGLFNLELKFSGSVGTSWNNSSPALKDVFVPLTLLVGCFIRKIHFIHRVMGDGEVTVRFEKNGTVLKETSLQVISGNNTIELAINAFFAEGEYTIRVLAENEMLAFPSRGEAAFVRNEYMTNEGTVYCYNNPKLVFLGVITIGSSYTDKSLECFDLPADANAVGTALRDKMDKSYSKNIFDPKTFRLGSFAYTGSLNVRYFPDNLRYGSTGFIPVSKKGLITKGSGTSGVTSQVVYDINKNPLRYVDSNDQYTYEEGDGYVVFCYKATSGENIAVVEGTEYVFEKYTDNYILDSVREELEQKIVDVQKKHEEVATTVEKVSTDLEAVLESEADIKKNVTALSEKIEQLTNVEEPVKETLDLLIPSAIYTVCNEINPARNYHVSVWLDHLIAAASWKNKIAGFGCRHEKYINMYSPIEQNLLNKGQTILEQTVSADIISDDFEEISITIPHRSTLSGVSRLKFPKVLVIGDSVTGGYLAGANKADPLLPNHYWSWTRYFFELDKIESGGAENEFNCLMLGITKINENNYGNYNYFTIDGKRVYSYAVGKGGWSAEDLNLPNFQSDTVVNPFYDTATGKFSLKVAVDRFKTLSEDGKTRLVVGETAGSDVVDVNAFDMCTPTHVVINLNHNSSLEEYQNNIPEIIATIKREYPEMIVVLMDIDETGTYFPAEYPDYNEKDILFTGLHRKNASIYKYMRESLEDEENGIYVLSGNLIQPNVASYPCVVYRPAEAYAMGEINTFKVAYGRGNFGGPNWHPNNLAHAAWGYQLYAFLKYTMSLDVNEEI